MPGKGERRPAYGIEPVEGPLGTMVEMSRPVGVWKGHQGPVHALAVSPDGLMLASGGKDRMVRLWDIPTGRSLAHWEAHDDLVTSLAFHPNGETLVSGSADGIVKLWNLPMIHRELTALGLGW